MHSYASFPSILADLDNLLLWHDHTLQRVLQADELGRAEVDIIFEYQARHDVVPGNVLAI